MSVQTSVKCERCKTSNKKIDDLGKSRRWLGDVENGQTDIKLSNLHIVAEKLGVDFNALFYGTPSSIYNNYHQQGTYIATQNNKDSKTVELYERIIKQLKERIVNLEKKLN